MKSKSKKNSDGRTVPNGSKIPYAYLLAGLVASAVFLTVIQPPISLSILAWMAWVPLLITISPKVKTVPMIVLAFLVGFGYWLGNIYWMANVTLPGWLALCFFMGLIWPLLAVCARFCRINMLGYFWIVPLLIVAAERLQGFGMGGFFWRFLSHSQFQNIALIQIADILGASGVTLVIAVVNGLVADLIIDLKNRKLIRAGNFAKVTFTALVLVMVIAYGRWRIEETPRHVEAGPRIAAVQSNIPQDVKKTFSSEIEILESLLVESKHAIASGAELVVWPETMVQANLDNRLMNLIDPNHSYRVIDTILREHSSRGAYLLVGAYGGRPHIDPNFNISLATRYNSAYMYLPDGGKSSEVYSKIHLVPFGEYIPFKKSAPWLYNFFMWFTPYNFDYTLDAGTDMTIFEMALPGVDDVSKRSFGTLICYEDAVPDLARKFVLDKNKKKIIGWLVNISNDGWFVRFKDEKVLPSTELVQHASVCSMRAVENRVPIVRSVNTGISCLIDSTGRIRDGYMAGNLPTAALQRRGMSGWFVDIVPIDNRVTFFSRFGPWLDWVAIGLFTVFLFLAIFGKKIKFQNGKSKTKDQNP